MDLRLNIDNWVFYICFSHSGHRKLSTKLLGILNRLWNFVVETVTNSNDANVNKDTVVIALKPTGTNDEEGQLRAEKFVS